MESPALNGPQDGAVARLLVRDGAGGRVIAFRVDRVAGGELLLERLSARYLARVIEGTVSGVRVGARVRLILEAALPDGTAGTGAASPVRARMLPFGSRTGGAALELRPHLGLQPTARPAFEVSDSKSMAACLKVCGPDGQITRLCMRAAAAPSAPLQAIEVNPEGSERPGVEARLVAGLRPGRLAAELNGERPAILAPPSLSPKTRLTLTPPESSQHLKPTLSAALSTAESAKTAAGPSALTRAVILDPYGTALSAEAVQAGGEDLADALLRVLLRTASADDRSPAGLAGRPVSSLAGGLEPASEVRPTPASSSWPLLQSAAEPALLAVAIDPDGGLDADEQSSGRRFHIDLDLSRLGRVRLELACIGRARHLVLRSECLLPAEWLAEMADLFGAALAISGRPGRFVAGRLASAPPTAPPSPAATPGPSLWA